MTTVIFLFILTSLFSNSLILIARKQPGFLFSKRENQPSEEELEKPKPIKMVAKKFNTLWLLATVLLIMELAIACDALSDCAKGCMPECLRLAGASVPQCGDACELVCNTQGKEPPRIGWWS